MRNFRPQSPLTTGLPTGGAIAAPDGCGGSGIEAKQPGFPSVRVKCAVFTQSHVCGYPRFVETAQPPAAARASAAPDEPAAGLTLPEMGHAAALGGTRSCGADKDAAVAALASYPRLSSTAISELGTSAAQ